MLEQDDINLGALRRERDRRDVRDGGARAARGRPAGARRSRAPSSALGSAERTASGEPFAPPPPWGELAMSPREAFLGPQEVVPAAEAVGAGRGRVARGLSARACRTCCPASGSPRRRSSTSSARSSRAAALRGASDRKLRTVAGGGSSRAEPTLARPRYTGVRTSRAARTSQRARRRGRRRSSASRSTPPPASGPGARFGPEAIRAARRCCGPYHPPLDVDVFGVAVGGRTGATSRSRRATRSAPPARSPRGWARSLAAGVAPIVLGGDHSIVLGELRAHAAAAGEPLALVLLDAHADTWDEYYGEKYFHGTPFRRAVEEGLLRPSGRSSRACAARSTRPATSADAREMGFEMIGGDELRALGPGGVRRRVRERVGDGAGLLLVRHRRDRPGVRARRPARPRWRACSRTRRSCSCARWRA